MSRTLFVQPHRAGGPVPNGTLSNPYSSIQAAVNASASLVPSHANPVTIAILQGLYRENVFIGLDGICLRGLGGPIRISPLQGPALVVSNATQASVQQYISGGDPAVLQSGKAGVHSVNVVDLSFETEDPASAAVYVVGCPDLSAPPFGDQEMTFSNCLITRTDPLTALHVYYCQYVHLRNSCELSGATRVIDCLRFLVDDSEFGDLKLDYDAKAPAGTIFGLVGNNAFCSGLNVELGGGTGFQPTINSTFWDLAVRGKTSFEMYGGTLNSLTVEGTAQWIGRGVQVNTDLTLQPGTRPVQFDGGRYMGTVVGAKERLIRNLGN